MKTVNKDITTFEELKDREYGPIGTLSRDEYEKGFEEFLVGVMIKEARLAQGMTQTQLAEKCETTKAYISKVENSVKDVRISTLRNIVERGLGGHLQVSIQL
ncbi:helix-turn-helix domain-containing protein [Mucilaginibacter sp. L3T2-6]|uniref:helix-turn-helix domain-containing protein n=1 Tax=Mucilaginibacter sp. L3T2-6 TaxID=3062491 RepID=UPI00267695B5|nr:helix-turn-helix transcriptional regulator [Mucilaginibacter sp. L3T2-6]MDO3643151.1 helix-turn-helix transcriptional regulator [Mucilaginibacter sp. L3T2-6]MDV6215475.1 helix-turn-helix transcriptional regulator [Mucilaginibacter sp. L3T2-6]